MKRILLATAILLQVVGAHAAELCLQYPEHTIAIGAGI